MEGQKELLGMEMSEHEGLPIQPGNALSRYLRVISTTNAIESVNSTLRKVTPAHQIFPSDDAVYKVVYLAVQPVTKHWTVPLSNWKAALNWFALAFSERIPQ